MVVEVLTNKITRSVAAVRTVVKDCGGKMADPGSVMFKFRRARVINIKGLLLYYRIIWGILYKIGGKLCVHKFYRSFTSNWKQEIYFDFRMF